MSLAYLICRVLLRAVVSGIRRVDAKDIEILVLRPPTRGPSSQEGQTSPSTSGPAHPHRLEPPASAQSLAAFWSGLRPCSRGTASW